MTTIISSLEKQLTEWSYRSTVRRDDPFNAIELDVKITHESGQSWLVPAFWSGGQHWRVRFTPPLPGNYEAVSLCSDAGDQGLHQVSHSLNASSYTPNNRLWAKGGITVADNKRYFEFETGSPFFWLGDTWWMALSQRLAWPMDFQTLTADRAAKGFSVIQLVAGLFPDMEPLDPRCANEAGFPWEKDFATINPAYFDLADLRVNHLVNSGLLPCIFGAWGYYLKFMGVEKMKQHWRYLVARWGALPVVWCLAGEAAMPYYLSENREQDIEFQREGWSDVGRYVREIDPYGRLITVHPVDVGRTQVIDSSVMDINMLQTGHAGYSSVGNNLKMLQSEAANAPELPIVIGEVNYEGIIHGNQDEIQRLTFWSSLLSGVAGYTYGVNGVWQVNLPDKPFGPSPHGADWGWTPWQDAMQLSGSTQLGLAVELLKNYRWWEFTPHPEWISQPATVNDVSLTFAGGIPGEVRLFYSYAPSRPWNKDLLKVLELESDVTYRACFWDPRDSKKYKIGTVEPDANGEWLVPFQPTFDDWILILEANCNI